MGKNRFSSWWCLWCKFIYLISLKFVLLFEKALDTFEPPTIPDNKRAVYLDTAYLWHSTALGDNARRRAPPLMIGESKDYSFQ